MKNRRRIWCGGGSNVAPAGRRCRAEPCPIKQSGATTTISGREATAEKEETVAIENWDVHFIPAYNPLVKEALSAATATDLDGVVTRILPAEHLMAIAPANATRQRLRAAGSIPGSRRCGPRPLQRNSATPRPRGELANLSGEVSAQSIMNKTVQRIFDRKAERRRELAALPFAKKIEIVEQLRELGRAMKKSRTQARGARR